MLEEIPMLVLSNLSVCGEAKYLVKLKNNLKVNMMQYLFRESGPKRVGYSTYVTKETRTLLTTFCLY